MSPRIIWPGQSRGFGSISSMPDGRPISQHVPASSLYHVFGAIAEADRVLGTSKP